MTVDHVGKHSIPGNLCLPLLEKSGNFMWSGKCHPVCRKMAVYVMNCLNDMFITDNRKQQYDPKKNSLLRDFCF